MHFLGSLSPALQGGLRFNGLTRSETKDTLNIVSRARILAGAAAWHAHGKPHPQEAEAEEVEEITTKPTWRKRTTSVYFRRRRHFPPQARQASCLARTSPR